MGEDRSSTIFGLISLFNHGKKVNLVKQEVAECGAWVLRAARDIKAGEELLLRYTEIQDPVERAKILKHWGIHEE